MFTTKKMSSLVFIEYIKEPINYCYRDRSTRSKSLNFFRYVIMGFFHGFEIHHLGLLKNHFYTLPVGMFSDRRQSMMVGMFNR
jgi:hypothetical protein